MFRVDDSRPTLCCHSASGALENIAAVLVAQQLMSIVTRICYSDDMKRHGSKESLWCSSSKADSLRQEGTCPVQRAKAKGLLRRGLLSAIVHIRPSTTAVSQITDDSGVRGAGCEVGLANRHWLRRTSLFFFFSLLWIPDTPPIDLPAVCIHLRQSVPRDHLLG